MGGKRAPKWKDESNYPPWRDRLWQGAWSSPRSARNAQPVRYDQLTVQEEAKPKEDWFATSNPAGQPGVSYSVMQMVQKELTTSRRAQVKLRRLAEERATKEKQWKLWQEKAKADFMKQKKLFESDIARLDREAAQAAEQGQEAASRVPALILGTWSPGPTAKEEEEDHSWERMLQGDPSLSDEALVRQAFAAAREMRRDAMQIGPVPMQVDGAPPGPGLPPERPAQMAAPAGWPLGAVPTPPPAPAPAPGAPGHPGKMQMDSSKHARGYGGTSPTPGGCTVPYTQSSPQPLRTAMEGVPGQNAATSVSPSDTSDSVACWARWSPRPGTRCYVLGGRWDEGRSIGLGGGSDTSPFGRADRIALGGNASHQAARHPTCNGALRYPSQGGSGASPTLRHRTNGCSSAKIRGRRRRRARSGCPSNKVPGPWENGVSNQLRGSRQWPSSQFCTSCRGDRLAGPRDFAVQLGELRRTRFPLGQCLSDRKDRCADFWPLRFYLCICTNDRLLTVNFCDAVVGQMSSRPAEPVRLPPCSRSQISSMIVALWVDELQWRGPLLVITCPCSGHTIEPAPLSLDAGLHGGLSSSWKVEPGSGCQVSVLPSPTWLPFDMQRISPYIDSVPNN